jgi:hypothetical protein
MQPAATSEQQALQELYDLAANLLLNEKKNSEEVKKLLIERGLSADAAYTIVRNVEAEVKKAKTEGARKDMLYGALWCIGGTVATIANVGFIFWGAIVFGGFQFIKGAINYFKD